jgi:uncharacterized protein
MGHEGQVLWLALAIGVAFGLVGQRTGFCLTSGLRNYLLERDGRKLRAYVLAMVTGILGTQLLASLGLIDLGSSLYLQPTFSWLLLPAGGVLFGYGMVAANGCGARALVLLGTGNLRSLLVVLCLGVSAHAVLRGVLAPARLWLAEWTAQTPGWEVPTLPGALRSLGLPSGFATGLALLFLTVPLLFFVLSSRDLRASPRDWIGGALIGLLVAAGWYATGYVGADPFEPVRVVSLTFVAPVGDAIQYLMLATGMRADFGILVVAGVPVGAFVAALAGGGLHWQGFESPAHMLRFVWGAALMGVGGALALGCSIGQGLTGVSTMALGSLLAAAGILNGAAAALRGPLRIAGR